ncbi:ubiquinone biosynthesis regulatory protein kinase UbiB [Saccharophagus sp. K07]|uniref:ubiquinone biosynthesis regulatory protein kinase UbiB n=1 Tax=Saccharophagus sp. K07 TaxID=2283636 RepID=UPI0016522B16|nr:ubiquinone biosynthesis regulatory protein kinase UbiB [Saccharophagus sp. K07]
MTHFRRLLTILATFGRYRIDELLPIHARPRALSWLMRPFRRTEKTELSRGQRLRMALEDLGPIFIKFGQLLSTRPDLLPPDIVEELNKLQDRVQPFPGSQFQAMVEQALGQPVDVAFARFDLEPLASASIAQVHAACLKDGTEVVVKAVRPGIENVIEQDVALMAWLAKLIERYSLDGQRLRPVQVVDEYRQTIFDELDLMREAANAAQLRRNFETSPLLYVPRIYWEYCRRRVLVMERIYGAQVTDLETLHKHGVDIKRLAERGVEIFFTQVFEHNFFHADMHPGNVYVSLEDPDNPSYIALDMAIIGSLSREDQFYLARNLLAMFRRDYRQVAELHVLSGWVPKDTPIGAFEAAIRTVCEPIFAKPIKDISFGDALITLFQTARRFDMPVQPQLVLLQKTLVNIEGLGRQLYPELDLWETAHPFLERWLKRRFHPKTLFHELRRQAPEWMEKFPEVPHLVFDTLHKINELGETAPELRRASIEIRNYSLQQQQRKRRRLIAAIAFAASAYWLWPSAHALPLEGVLLAAVGLIALLMS